MRRIILLIVVLIFISNNLVGQNSRDSLQTKIGHTVLLKSKHLKDSVKLFVHLPFCYQPGKKYPLVLLFDGNTTFKTFSSCTELLAYDRAVPCCIVVGFPQYKYVEFDKDNLEEKMDKLLNFCGEELLPYLQSKYNITKKIILGQGKSGMISSYMMFEKPDLFNSYISDVPDFSLVSAKINSENVFENLRNKKVSYYFFGSTAMNLHNELFLNNLKARAPNGLNWKYSVSDENNAIIHFITNYMHAIELFFNEPEK